MFGAFSLFSAGSAYLVPKARLLPCISTQKKAQAIVSYCISQPTIVKTTLRSQRAQVSSSKFYECCGALSQPLNEGEVLKHVVNESERGYISSAHNIGNVEYNSLTTYKFSTASAVEIIQFRKLYNSEAYVAENSTNATNAHLQSVLSINLFYIAQKPNGFALIKKTPSEKNIWGCPFEY